MQTYATPTNPIAAGNRKVLLIDDDPDYLTVLRMAIKGTPGIETVTAESAEEAFSLLETDSFDLILTDLQLPGLSGVEFVSIARERGFHAPILVLTGHGSVAAAVDALKAGAQDYLQKPVEPERLRALVAMYVQNAPPTSLAVDLPHATGDDRYEGILGTSQAIRDVFDRIERVAHTDATVLIVGESGTGKELVARAIHRRSARAKGPIVPVHAGAIPRELIASELFGHEKGSFTGAVTSADGKFDAAFGGTLFLDEIGTMEHAVQIALLRVLETFKFTRVGGRKERDADVRIVAATNRDLLEMVMEGSFREDLYYRLNVFTIALPPLRDRPEDLALIANHYLREFGKRYRTPARRLSEAALERLYSHAWPGNVRELRNVMEQTSVFAPHEEVLADEVQLVSTHIVAPAARGLAPPSGVASNDASSRDTGRFATQSPSNQSSEQPPAVSVAMPQSAAPSREPWPAVRANDMPSNIETPVPRESVAVYRPAPPVPSPFAPDAATARRMLGAIAANHSDERLVLRFPVGTTLDEAEKQLTLRTLEVLGGNKQKAARVLGISRRCLYNKLATYGISASGVLEEEPALEPEEIDGGPAAKPLGAVSFT